MANSRSLETEKRYGLSVWGQIHLDYCGRRRARIQRQDGTMIWPSPTGRVYLYDPRLPYPHGPPEYELGPDPYPAVYRWLLQGILPAERL